MHSVRCTHQAHSTTNHCIVPMSNKEVLYFAPVKVPSAVTYVCPSSSLALSLVDGPTKFRSAMHVPTKNF